MPPNNPPPLPPLHHHLQQSHHQQHSSPSGSHNRVPGQQSQGQQQLTGGRSTPTNIGGQPGSSSSVPPSGNNNAGSRSHNEDPLFSNDFLNGWDPTRQQPQSRQHQSGYSSGTNNGNSGSAMNSGNNSSRDQDVAVGHIGVSAADLDLVSSLGVELEHNDEDDEEDEDDENSANKSAANASMLAQQSQAPRKHKKGGGRPRDFIWKFYAESRNDDGKTQASCKACGWTAEQPKAFRMRQHVLSCDGILQADKDKVEAIKAQKDAESAKRALLKKNGEKIPRNRNRGRQAEYDDDDEEDEAGSPSSLRGLLAGATGNGDDDEYAYPSVTPQVSFLSGTGTSNKRKRKSNLDTSFQTPALFQNMDGPTRKSPITCHVLDSSAGKPGANIKIRMDQLGTTGFNHVASGETDADGRANHLLGNRDIEPGSIFKLTFYTREYFSAKQIKCFHPFVEITFEVEEPKEHYHVALLISPFSYTTYRGS